MPDYLLSGTNAKGRHVVERVTASSAAEAVAVVRMRGFADVKLHTDDTTSWVQASDNKRKEIRKHLSPQAELKLSTVTRAGATLITIGEVYRALWIILIPAGVLLAWRRVAGAPWEWIDYTSLGFFALPMLVVLLMSRHSRTFTRIQRAAVAARWNDVLRLAPKLEHSLKKRGAIALEPIVWRAKALAALGRLDEGLKVMSSTRGRLDVPEGVYLAQLATVFEAANDHEGSLVCYQEGAELSPGEPIVWLGLAETLAVRFRRVPEACAALDVLRKFELTDQTRSGIRLIEGAIALAQRRFDAACEHLEAFHSEIVNMSRTAPFAVSVQRQAEALLAIAHVGCDDRRTALAYFQAAEPFLRLHQDHDMLRRCQEALPEAARPLGGCPLVS